MPSLFNLKSPFQQLLRPIVLLLAKSGVTANQVTIAAVLLSFLGGSLIIWQPKSSWPLLVLPIILLIRMAMNAIDGMLAREHGQQSSLGAILNEMGDVVADAALYLPLALLPNVNAVLVVLLVIMAIMSELIGVVAVQIGAHRQYQGPMGKSDRAFCIGAIGLLLGCGVQAIGWVDGLLALMLFLLVITIINRAKGALNSIS